MKTLLQFAQALQANENGKKNFKSCFIAKSYFNARASSCADENFDEKQNFILLFKASMVF